jgi:hypothetical protein
VLQVRCERTPLSLASLMWGGITWRVCSSCPHMQPTHKHSTLQPTRGGGGAGGGRRPAGMTPVGHRSLSPLIHIKAEVCLRICFEHTLLPCQPPPRLWLPYISLPWQPPTQTHSNTNTKHTRWPRRSQYDPSPRVAEAMKGIWVAMVDDTRATCEGPRNTWCHCLLQSHPHPQQPRCSRSM